MTPKETPPTEIRFACRKHPALQQGHPDDRSKYGMALELKTVTLGMADHEESEHRDMTRRMGSGVLLSSTNAGAFESFRIVPVFTNVRRLRRIKLFD